jgi:flagellar protein FlaG
VRAAVADTIAALARRAGELEFLVDADNSRAIVRVVDKETKQVVRQIPAPEMMAIRRALDRVQGILIRAKA